MIRILLSFLVLAITPVFLFAQQPENNQPAVKSKPMYLDLSGGVSFPIGKSYTSTDMDNSKSGYASTGYFIQANFAYLGRSLFGIAGQVTYQHNSFNSGAVNDTLEGTRYPLGNKGWNNAYLMVGPVYLQSFKKVILEIEGLIGLMLSFSPVFNDTDPADGSNHHNTGTGVGLGFRVGVGYEFSPHFTAMLNLNYLGGFPNLNKEYEPMFIGYDTNGQPRYTNLTEIEIKKIVSTMNIGAGIIYKF
jgi:hypothetical protein